MRSSAVATLAPRGMHRDDAPDEQLEISLFGTLVVRQGGYVVPLRVPAQAVRLLAYLLLHRERGLSREHVAFTLWPDDDEADARANLRRKLHLLGRALPARREPWIATTPTSIAWNSAAPYRLDVAEFEVLSMAEATWTDADALYGGDLLVDLDDDWIVRERDRLRTIAIDTVSGLVARCRKQRDFANAIRLGQRLRALDPWREDAIRGLIWMRYEAGDRAGALTEYERFRASLRSEIGVDPMPETICVYERVLAHAPAAASERTPTDHLRGVPTRAPDLPFVGRGREFSELEAGWTKAFAGSGNSLLIAGEAGVGKTRLIEEFATFVESRGGRVLRGGTTPFELAPYQPIFEALRNALPLLREARIERLWLAVLATLVPQLRVAFPDLGAVSPLDPDAERTRLFDAVEHAIIALCAARPTVLILEDMHWAGSATLELFEYVARHAPPHRLLILASYREEELTRTHPLRALRRRLERERLLMAVAVGPLSRVAIEEIVGQFVDVDGADRAGIARSLHDRSEGNPFFLSEVIANDREAGRLDVASRSWDRSETPHEFLLPLTSTVAARLDRLSPQARSIAEIAAVIGRSFSAELVREASGINERSTLDSLGELIDRRIVREFDRAGADFAFSHQLIVQTIYTAMKPEIRQRRHRRVGDVIEELYGQHVEQFSAELASQFDLGGEPERAAEYYCLAARHALALYGNDEAATLAARGQQLAVDPELRFRSIEIIEEVSRRRGDRDAQRASITQLSSIAREIDRPELVREALRRRVLLAHDCGERELERASIAELENGLSGAPSRWEATVAQLKGSYLTTIGSYREARAVLSGALAGVSAIDHPRIDVECRCALVQLARFEGRVDELRAFLAQIAALDTTSDLTRAVTLLETACAAATSIQDYAALDACADRLLSCSRAIGYRQGEAAALAFTGRAALRLFEIERARTNLRRATEMFASIGQRLKVVGTTIELGNLATTIGRFDEAIAHFEAAGAIASTISYGFGKAACANNISYTAYLKGDFELARSAAQTALEAADAIGAPSARAHALVSIGVAERELHDAGAAIAHLEEGTALERRLNETIALGEDLCELIIALLRHEQIARAALLAREVLDLAEGSVQQFSHPQYLFWTAALVHHVTGDDARAASLLIRARAKLDELEAAIPDAESRRTFRNSRYNRAIDDAFERDLWVI